MRKTKKIDDGWMRYGDTVHGGYLGSIVVVKGRGIDHVKKRRSPRKRPKYRRREGC